MKSKHNKKRNTAFVFEALAREATTAIIKGDTERKQKVVSIVRKHFSGDSLLKKDLECYRSLYENQNLDQDTCKKILETVTSMKRLIDPDGLFKQQTEVIKDINKDLGSATFNNFVPNYKTLATIAKMFNTDSPKQRVMLESKVIEGMKNSTHTNNLEPIDSLTFSTFAKKFNKKYESSLLSEQKALLNYYISSFAQDDLETKIFINNEISRLKESLDAALTMKEISEDKEMVRKTKLVKERIQSLSEKQKLDESCLLLLMRTQELVREVERDAGNS